MLDKQEHESCIVETKNDLIYEFFKRLIDIVGSIAGLIILSPLLIIVSILIKLDSKGPIIFSHSRLGKNGDIIKIYKFRTMIQNADEVLKNLTSEEKKEFQENFKLKHDPRITKLGRFLRNSSIDELPQLLNVLKGEMTAVGPRPIVPKELEKYGQHSDKLLSVKPGLTGNWQTSGRSETTYEERVQLDMNYIDNRNILMDIKICLKTVIVVFKQAGAR